MGAEVNYSQISQPLDAIEEKLFYLKKNPIMWVVGNQTLGVLNKST